MTDAAGGLRWVLFATAVAGVLGYLIQVGAPALLTERDYIAFSVVWSTVYLCGAAMTGVQQEVARAARPRRTPDAPTIPTSLRTFTLLAAVPVLVVSTGLAVWLSQTSVSVPAAALVATLGVALVGYLLTSVLAGVLYGLHLWRLVATLVVVDAVLRALLLGVALVLRLPPVWLATAIAVPFGLAVLVTWLLARSRVVGGFALDVSLRALSGNVVSTVGSSASSGLMISGLPLVLGIAGAGEPESVVGALIMAITLSRAPIIVPVVALQSFLISAVFRDRGSAAPGRMLVLLAGAAGATAVLSVLAGLIGPTVIEVVSAGAFSVSAATMATIVASAGAVALMSVTGAALVGARRHVANLLGWGAAAAATVMCVLVPGDFTVRVLVALAVPAVLGLALHVVALLRPPTSWPQRPSSRSR